MLKYGGYLLLLLLPLLAQAQISILPSYRANAAELVPIIQSQLGSDGSVQVYQNQLILNASAEDTQKIKALLEKIDGKARSLLISIKVEQNQTQAQSQTQVSVSKQKTDLQLQKKQTDGQGFGRQVIRATEGFASFISIGQSRLISAASNTHAWQSVSTGFYARAYIYQNTVNVQIEQQDGQLAGGNTTNKQQLLSQVQGALGQWMRIGVLNQAQVQKQTLGGNQQQNNKVLYLKVDLLE